MTKQYVDVIDAGNVILDAIGSKKTWEAIKDYSDEFKRGAMWGMPWAMTHIYANAPKHTSIERYPCQHCGSCPVWLAAGDTDEINTYHELLEACFKKGCNIVGTEVI